MENFKHLPEPFRIRVIEPVKRTTRAYREEAIIKSGMNPFLLDSEDVFGNDSNLLIVFYVQIMPDDFVMQLHRF